MTISQPFEVIGLDHVGPFPETPEGFAYILVMVDYFLRYSWLVPCRLMTVADAVKAVKMWFDWMAVRPLAFYSD